MKNKEYLKKNGNKETFNEEVYVYIFRNNIDVT